MDIDVESIVRENINKVIHLSLATVNENKPWVCEVHFAYDNELNLYFRSKLSRRHSQEIECNSAVSGTIIKQHEINEEVLGVYFEGKAERLDGVLADDSAFVALNLRFGLEEKALFEAAEPDGYVFYKITVNNWYVFGKFGADHGQKLQLKWK